MRGPFLPSIETFAPRELGPKPWGSELLIACTPHYIGKILRMKGGHRGGLQYHITKEESFHLVSGACRVFFDAGKGLESMVMQPGDTYHVPCGAVHQVEALEDSVLFEVSVPAFDDRVNVGAQYGVGERGDAW